MYSTLIVHFAILLLLSFLSFARLFCQQIRACGFNGERIVQCDFVLCASCFQNRFIFSSSQSPFHLLSLIICSFWKSIQLQKNFIVVDEHDWLSFETNNYQNRLNVSLQHKIIRSFWYNLMRKYDTIGKRENNSFFPFRKKKEFWMFEYCHFVLH